jgi:hypothetical protein
LTAATSVVWSAEFTALSTMSRVGSIAWPPTEISDARDMLVPCANAGTAEAAVAARRGRGS